MQAQFDSRRRQFYRMLEEHPPGKLFAMPWAKAQMIMATMIGASHGLLSEAAEGTASLSEDALFDLTELYLGLSEVYNQKFAN